MGIFDQHENFLLFQVQLLQSKNSTIRMLNDLLSKKDTEMVQALAQAIKDKDDITKRMLGELEEERRVNRHLNQIVGLLLRKEETNVVSAVDLDHSLEVMEKPIESSVSEAYQSNMELGASSFDSAFAKQQVVMFASKAEKNTATNTGFLPFSGLQPSASNFVAISDAAETSGCPPPPVPKRATTSDIILPPDIPTAEKPTIPNVGCDEVDNTYKRCQHCGKYHIYPSEYLRHKERCKNQVQGSI